MQFVGTLLNTNDFTVFDKPSEWAQTHGLNIIIIIVATFVLRRMTFLLITSVLNRAIRHHPFANESDRKKRTATLDGLVNTVTKLVFWSVATIMIVDELGINTAPLLASAGILGVALGIGAQSLIKDFTNGLFIIIENQYRVGDYVRFDQVEGIVEAITIRTTILRDMDGNIHHVPNSSIVVSTNMTFGHSGINQDLTVSLDTDLDKLAEVIDKIGTDLAENEAWHTKIKTAPHMAQIVSFGERGVVVKILGQTTPGSQWKVKTELIKRLGPALLDAGIDLPFAPRDSRTKDKPAAKKTSK